METTCQISRLSPSSGLTGGIERAFPDSLSILPYIYVEIVFYDRTDYSITRKGFSVFRSIFVFFHVEERLYMIFG